MNARTALSPTNLALVGVFAGLIAASTLWPGVELASGVPITLQTLAVLLTGAVLGPWRGAAAVLLYLVVGTAGAPVWAGHSAGPSVWTGGTAGFLGAFVLAAFVTGLIVRTMRRRGNLTTTGIVGAAAVGGLLVIDALGFLFLVPRFGMSVSEAVAASLPFLPGDIIKVFIVGVTAAAVHRAYPGLLGAPTAVKAKASAQADADAPKGASAVV